MPVMGFQARMSLSGTWPGPVMNTHQPLQAPGFQSTHVSLLTSSVRAIDQRVYTVDKGEALHMLEMLL